MGDENVLTLMKADKGDTLPQYKDYVVKYHWKGLGLQTGHTVKFRKGVYDVPGQNSCLSKLDSLILTDCYSERDDVNTCKLHSGFSFNLPFKTRYK